MPNRVAAAPQVWLCWHSVCSYLNLDLNRAIFLHLVYSMKVDSPHYRSIWWVPKIDHSWWNAEHSHLWGCSMRLGSPSSQWELHWRSHLSIDSMSHAPWRMLSLGSWPISHYWCTQWREAGPSAHMERNRPLVLQPTLHLYKVAPCTHPLDYMLCWRRFAQSMEAFKPEGRERIESIRFSICWAWIQLWHRLVQLNRRIHESNFHRLQLTKCLPFQQCLEPSMLLFFELYQLEISSDCPKMLRVCASGLQRPVVGQVRHGYRLIDHREENRDQRTFRGCFSEVMDFSG